MDGTHRHQDKLVYAPYRRILESARHHMIRNPFFFMAVAAFVLVQGALLMVGTNPLAGGDLADSDAYMRLARVLELEQGKGWFNSLIHWSNAPYGESLHWTRPLDAILYLGASIGALLFGFDSSLMGFGIALSPLLAVGALAALAWGVRPFLPAAWFALFGLLFALQPGPANFFMLGRPDHHALQLFLFSWETALLLRFLHNPARARLPLAAGFLAGLALWVGIEALLPAAAMMTALGLRWAFGASRDASHLMRFAWGFFVAITLAMVLEHPPHAWNVIAFDSLSRVHWTLAAASALVCTILFLFAERLPSRASRLIAGVIAGAVVAASVALTAPRFYLGALADVDPVVEDVIFHHISEARGLLPTDRTQLFFFLQQLGPVILAACYCAFRLRRADGAERNLHILLLTGLAAYGLAALTMMRWAAFAQILALLPWTLLLHRIWNHAGRARAGLFLAACVGPFLLTAFAAPRAETLSGRQEPPCDIAAVRKALNGLEPKGDILLTHLFDGPMMVYGTGFRIIGTPYHRNTAGIRDTLDIFGTSDWNKAHERLNERGVGLVLVCRSSFERALYEKYGAKDSVFDALRNDRPPNWLTPIALPPSAQETFRLYRMQKP